TRTKGQRLEIGPADGEHDEISRVFDRELIGVEDGVRRAEVAPRREIQNALRHTRAKVVQAEWSDDGRERKARNRRALHADCGEVQSVGGDGRVTDDGWQQFAARGVAETA